MADPTVRSYTTRPVTQRGSRFLAAGIPNMSWSRPGSLPSSPATPSGRQNYRMDYDYYRSMLPEQPSAIRSLYNIATGAPGARQYTPSREDYFTGPARQILPGISYRPTQSTAIGDDAPDWLKALFGGGYISFQ